MSFAQVKNTAYQGGEQLRFAASYYMSGLWSDIAEVKMNVLNAKSGSTPLHHLQFTARTYSSWDSYFKIRDSYQSWVSPTTVKPYLFKRDVAEGAYTLKAKYIFKRKSLIAKSTRQKGTKAAKVKNVKITSGTFDLASALYYVRSIDYANSKVGKIYKLTILVDNELLDIYVKYRGIENKKVGKYGIKKCYKVGVAVRDQSIMKNNATNNIWFTADKNKVPVLVKAVIPVGSIQIRLVDMKGLRNK